MTFSRVFAHLFVITLGTVFVIGANTYVAADSQAVPWQTPPSIANVVDSVLADRKAFLETDSAADFGSDTEINVLVLGLDARKGSKHPHCDGIHMFTLDLEDWTMHITSVPRGTYAYFPGNYASTEYYLANACSYVSLEYGIEQIEKIVGVKADYYVTAGFSQVIGIMRLFKLPTTESLQWLRHRQSYAIGDPQRSHNQAVFMKDLIVSQTDRFRKEFGTPMLYILYTMVETDMDFKTARAIFDGYLATEIDKNPERITLSMKPFYETVDYHFDFEDPDQQVQKLIDRLKPYLSKDDLSLRTLDSVQTELIAFLEDAIDDKESVEMVIDQQLWRQVEDEKLREEWHYTFMEKTAQMAVNAGDTESAVDLITAYIIEMEALNEEQWALRAKNYLSTLVKE